MFNPLIPKFHTNYKKFVGWSICANILLSTESTMSTHCILSVVTDSPTQFAVSYNFLFKDILGQLGSLFFVHRYSGMIDEKPFRFVTAGNILFQACFFLEFLTPILPLSYFIPLTVIANLGKNIGYIQFGAVNTKCIQELALDNNISEVYSKLAIVNTLCSSIGMGLGLGIIYLVPDHTHRLLYICPVIAIMRFYSYHKMVKTVL